MSEEKRKHKRYPGKEGAFAAFLGPDQLINLGKVVDISLGGLCVRYLAINKVSAEYSEIKVFGSNGRFIHLDRVPCRVVYDVEVPEGSWDQVSTRRCGVQFEDVSVRHQTMIHDFMEHFTRKESATSASTKSK